MVQTEIGCKPESGEKTESDDPKISISKFFSRTVYSKLFTLNMSQITVHFMLNSIHYMKNNNTRYLYLYL